MAANSALRVTELSYDTLRSNFKTFLGQQTEMVDYNLEGSTMSIILDLLAYTSYQSAFYDNMVANEMFIDSAVLRQSVVSRAKAINYTPRSAKSPLATIQVTITPGDSPTFITIPRNTTFGGVLNSITYNYVTTGATTLFPVSGVYSANVEIAEGFVTTDSYTVSITTPVQYVINNKTVDTDSIVVKVRENEAATTSVTYSLVSDLSVVDGDSTVYFLEENLNGKYEILFGDGILGNDLDNNNYVTVEYRVTDGPISNDMTGFIETQTISGYTGYSIITQARSAGGQNIEGTESIRFSAPRNYDMQNRAVTENDYKRMILNDHSDIDAISVWGGEENIPAVYGKVYISAKPLNGFVLTQARKDKIVASLETRNVVSIDPELVDASFIYIIPEVIVRFDPTETSLKAAEVRALVGTTITNFETSELGNFDRKFRLSKLIQAVDLTHPSIKSSLIMGKFQKRFNPTLNSSVTYKINFNTEFHRTGHVHTDDPDNVAVVSSTGFTLPAYTNTLFIDDDGSGILRTYYIDGSSKTYINTTSVGTVDYDTGTIQLDNFNPTSIVGQEINISIQPKNFEISPVRNQILLISGATIDVYDDITGLLVSSGSITTLGTTETTNESAIATTITV